MVEQRRAYLHEHAHCVGGRNVFVAVEGLPDERARVGVRLEEVEALSVVEVEGVDQLENPLADGERRHRHRSAEPWFQALWPAGRVERRA